jgi:hypothetical protein
LILYTVGMYALHGAPTVGAMCTERAERETERERERERERGRRDYCKVPSESAKRPVEV